MSTGYAVKNNNIKMSETNKRENEQKMPQHGWGLLIGSLVVASVILSFLTTIF